MFPFKYEKTLQAVAYLLRREPSRQMNYMRLIKVLYMADRESIMASREPITGDSVVAMKRGPVLSHLLDLVKGHDIRSPQWTTCVQREGYVVRLVSDPGNGALSEHDMVVLDKVAEQFQDHDEWDMVEHTHRLAEVKKRNPGNSMEAIPLADILEAVGRAGDLESIEDDAKADAAFAALFGT